MTQWIRWTALTINLGLCTTTQSMASQIEPTESPKKTNKQINLEKASQCITTSDALLQETPPNGAKAAQYYVEAALYQKWYIDNRFNDDFLGRYAELQELLLKASQAQFQYAQANPQDLQALFLAFQHLHFPLTPGDNESLEDYFKKSWEYRKKTITNTIPELWLGHLTEMFQAVHAHLDRAALDTKNVYVRFKLSDQPFDDSLELWIAYLQKCMPSPVSGS